MNTLSTINNPLGGTPVEGQGRRAEAGGGRGLEDGDTQRKSACPGPHGGGGVFLVICK